MIASTYIMTIVDLYVVGDRLWELSRKWVRLSSISSISRTGRHVSGSWWVPRYWIMLGCRMVLKNSHSS